MNRRITLKLLSALLISIGTTSAFAQATTTIKVGQTSGPHAKIMELVKTVAARDGLNIELVEFSDYIQPNAALDAGDLDANSYQSLPFMKAQVKARGYKITNVANTVLFPMGFYSKKYKSLKDLPQGSTIAIQNDPANAGRSLVLMAKYGVIKLRDGVGDDAILRDITANPQKLNIVQIDAGQLPRSLEDLPAASINTSFATKAGLVPKRDAIALEGTDSIHTNILAVRIEDQNKPWVKQLVKAYQSPEVKQFINKEFGDFAIPSF